jgi:DNA-binding transcriptional regulator YiaG
LVLGVTALELIALRRRLGLTQAAFAAQYGLNLRTLQGWEAGKPISIFASRFLDQLIDLNKKSGERSTQYRISERQKRNA